MEEFIFICENFINMKGKIEFCIRMFYLLYLKDMLYNVNILEYIIYIVYFVFIKFYCLDLFNC